MRLGMGLGLGNLLSGQPITGLANKYSFNFDDSNDYLDISTESGLMESSTVESQGVSLSAWVKFNATSTTQSFETAIVGTTISTGHSHYSGGGLYINFNAYQYKAKMMIYKNGAYVSLVGSTVLSTDTWYHICGVYSGENGDDKMRIYVNGSLDGTSSALGGDLLSGTQKFGYVGRNIRDTVPMYFDGLIDEVGIWDTALSADDVAKIGSKPVDLSKPSKYATDRTSNLKLWLRAGDKVLPENDTAIARQDFYTDFDGTDDCIQIQDLTFTTALSVSAWVNHSSISGDQTYVADWDYPNNGRSFQFRWNDDSTDKLEFHVSGDGSTIKTNTVNWTPTVGKWYHLVATYDAGTSKIYIDGVSQTVTSDASQPTSLHSSSDVVLIGANGNTSTRGNFMNGGISSVSLYQTALDAQTISQMAKSRFTPMRDNRFSVVDFDGSDDYIDLPMTFSYTNHSVIAWVYIEDDATGKIIFEAMDGATDGILITAQSNESIRTRINDNSSDYTTTIYSNQWVHLAHTYDGSYRRLYINGERVINQATTQTINTTTNARIGARNYGTPTDYFNGSMSSVSLYTEAKTAEEVYAIYQQGITYNESSESDLFAYYRMGDDTSKAYPTIADSSSNSNDGTITNGASDDIVQQMVAGYDLGAFESSSEELGGDFARAVTADNWTPYANMTVNTITGGVSIVAPTTASGLSVSANGAFIYFRGGVFLSENQLTTKDLEIGKIYSVTFNAFYSGGASGVYADIYNSSESVFSDEFTTTNTSYTMVFEAKNATTSLLRFQQIKLDNTVYITDITVKEVLQSEVSDTYPAIIDVNEPVLGIEASADPNMEGSGNNDDPYRLNSQWTFNTTDNRLQYDDTSTTVVYQFNSRMANSFVANQLYRIKFTIGGLTNGVARLAFAPGDLGYYFVADNIVGYENGTHYAYFTTTESGSDSNGFAVWGFVDSGSSWYFTELSFKPVLGNVGTMTNQASDDLVYSSVLPDQSFLTGANSSYGFGSFDGTNDIVTVSAINTDYKSFSVWVKPTTTVTKSSGSGPIGSFFSDSLSVIWIGAFASGLTDELVTIYNGGSINTSWENAGSASFPNDSWTHLALVWDGSKYQIYYNGQPQTTTTSGSHASLQSNNAITVGRGGASRTEFFDGDIAGVALWNKSLSASEVSAIYTAGRHTNLLDSYSDNLITYLAFGNSDATSGVEDTSSTIYDRSGNSNHGTVSGTTLQSPPNAEPNGYAKGDTNRSTTTP